MKGTTQRFVSVALSLGLRPLGVTQRPALWCPDFPLQGFRRTLRSPQRLPGLLPHDSLSRGRNSLNALPAHPHADPFFLRDRAARGAE